MERRWAAATISLCEKALITEYLYSGDSEMQLSVPHKDNTIHPEPTQRMHLYGYILQPLVCGRGLSSTSTALWVISSG